MVTQIDPQELAGAMYAAHEMLFEHYMPKSEDDGRFMSDLSDGLVKYRNSLPSPEQQHFDRKTQSIVECLKNGPKPEPADVIAVLEKYQKDIPEASIMMIQLYAIMPELDPMLKDSSGTE